MGLDFLPFTGVRVLGASKLSAVVAKVLSDLIDTTEVLQEILMMRFREAYGG